MTFSKVHIVLFLALCVLSVSYGAQGAVIFEENYDASSDWTVAQPVSDYACLLGGSCSTPPSDFTDYYTVGTNIGRGVCGGSNAYNDFYLTSIPGYPAQSSGTCRGGSGKCMTYWQERCCTQQVCSTGEIGKDLGADYGEIYIRYYIKFSPTWAWIGGENVPQMKLLHIQHYSGSGTPYSYFGQSQTNQPIIIPGIKTYHGDVYFYIAYRCENNYYCQGTPSYASDVGSDQDHVNLGAWSSVLGDGNWHSFEFYAKMNSGVGVKDGVAKFWLDGTLKYDSSTHNGGQGIPFSDTGGDTNPRRGWRHVSIGGNNSNQGASCSGPGCEQWYAIDDIAISTTYVGPTGGDASGGNSLGAPRNLRIQ